VAPWNGREDVTHIARKARDTQQARFLVQHPVDFLGTELSFPHEEGQNSRIDRARACTHHQAVERSESHRGIHAAAAANGRHRTAIAEMAGHQSERPGIFAEQTRGTVGAVLMVDAMESVAPNAALEPFIGSGIDSRRSRHLAMKPGIENGNLRNASEKIFDDVHSLKLSANVQWRKRGHAVDC
jgi:hypothetical protein